MTGRVEQLEASARSTLDNQLFAYIAGGAGEGVTLRENRRAFDRRTLSSSNGRTEQAITTAASILGFDLSIPILVAPLAYQAAVHVDAELAVMRATDELGTALCLSAFGSVSSSDLRTSFPDGQWLQQLYLLKDRGLQDDMIDRSIDAGAMALMVTVDPPRPIRCGRDVLARCRMPSGTSLPSLGGQTRRATTPRELLDLVDQRLSWQTIGDMASHRPLPLIVKGILNPADARLACEHGASAVVVSNHGGRHLDEEIPSLDALTPVIEEVGDQVEVYLDGGVRSGDDVAKAMALGAKAVLLGRPVMWALAVGGGDAVAELLCWLRDDLARSLGSIGCTSTRSLDPSLVGGREGI